MSDLILEKLDSEWAAAVRCQDYALAGKVLRSKLNLLKSAGALSEHKQSLGEWVSYLEQQLQDLPATLSLTVIGHLRHARKALSLTGSDVGSAFREPISETERARFRKRNRPPRLGAPDRSQLPAGYANGRPSVYLQSGGLDSGPA